MAVVAPPSLPSPSRTVSPAPSSSRRGITASPRSVKAMGFRESTASLESLLRRNSGAQLSTRAHSPEKSAAEIGGPSVSRSPVLLGRRRARRDVTSSSLDGAVSLGLRKAGGDRSSARLGSRLSRSFEGSSDGRGKLGSAFDGFSGGRRVSPPVSPPLSPCSSFCEASGSPSSSTDICSSSSNSSFGGGARSIKRELHKSLLPAPSVLNVRRGGPRQRSGSASSFRAHATCLQRGGSKHACVVTVDMRRSVFEVNVPNPTMQWEAVSLALDGDNFSVDVNRGLRNGMVVTVEAPHEQTQTFSLVFGDAYSATRMLFQLYSLRSSPVSLRGLTALASACVQGRSGRGSADPSFCPTFFKLHVKELNSFFPGQANLLAEHVKDATEERC